VGDRIDDLMTERWPRLKESVSCGLAVKPTLEEFVTAEPVEDATPYRTSVIEWEEVMPALFLCRPAIEGAFELSVSMSLTIDDLKDEASFKQLLDQVQGFAHDARRSERQALLYLLDAEARIAPYTPEGIFESVDELSRPCRLIGVPDETAKWAVRRGIVEQSVDPQIEFPSGAAAIILSLGSGPKWRRVVDDLLLTWHRGSETAARLRLSERFFLDNPSTAIRLM
jgi:hypothetical protein